MNRDEIIAMAREAGMEVHERKGQIRIGSAVLTGADSTDEVTRFAALVAAKERERLFGKAQRDGEMRLILHRREDGRCFAAAAHFSAEQTHCGGDGLLTNSVERLGDSLDACIAAAICA